MDCTHFSVLGLKRNWFRPCLRGSAHHGAKLGQLWLVGCLCLGCPSATWAPLPPQDSGAQVTGEVNRIGSSPVRDTTAPSTQGDREASVSVDDVSQRRGGHADQTALSSESPFGDPVVKADARLSSSAAKVWSDGESRYLLLDGGVTFEVGTYGFGAQRAVIRINFEGLPGRTIHHLAAYLDVARPLHGAGPVRAEASRLLVTCSTTGGVELYSDILRELEAPPHGPLVTDAVLRMRRYDDLLRRPTIGVPPGPPLVDLEALHRRSQRRKTIADQTAARLTQQIPFENLVMPAERVTDQPDTPAVAEVDKPAPPATAPPPDDQRGLAITEAFRILPDQGTVLFNAKNIVRPGPEEYGENMLLLFGDVAVLYQDRTGERSMALRADRAVVFLEPDVAAKLGQGKADPSDVRGVYLEANVLATNGQYTIRAPRVYYDPPRNKAILLDAVFYSWDVRRKVPIYMRAEQLRQVARNSWRAPRALLTTSEFGEPHFAIAAQDMTYQQHKKTDGTVAKRFTAKHITGRLHDVPIFYWPYMAGEAGEVPLRSISGRYRDKTGFELKTAWDLFALAGQPRPENVDLTGQVDYLGDHGPALGLNLDYERDPMYGFLDSYLVVADSTEDEVSNLKKVEQDGDSRGYALWRHRQYLRDNWELSLEAAFVSDDTFLDEFFRSEADTNKPYETSIYLKKQQDDWAFTFLSQYELFDFTAQNTPLQAPGYTVEKLPELGYYLVGKELWKNRLTYYSQTRAGRMRIRAGDDSPADRGFSPLNSRINFGIPMANTHFDDAAAARGIPSDYRWRFDTRHEIQAPMKLGMLNVLPYLAGRVTAYDDDFDDFSGKSDSVRLWGTLGMRLRTHFSRTDDDVEIPALDVHRLKHIVEPMADISLAAANLNPEDIPVYDRDVEGIREGATVRLGVRNTLQTQRGGPGRWRTVDWIVVQTDLVLSGDDTDVGTPVARFIGFRPELSTGGDHFHGNVMWLISDTLATIAEINQNLETDTLAEWRVGGMLQHTPQLGIHWDIAEIEALDSRLMSYGFNYQLTRKYWLGFIHRLDLEAGDARKLEVRLTRKLPRWQVTMAAAHDDIDGEQTIHVVVSPEGAPTSRAMDVFDTREPW